MIGSILNAGVNAATGFYNAASSNYWNRQNLNFQKENLEYQKALQQQIFEREDTSYQRTADDMRAAGLNPLSMNGANGAGEAIMTSAQQADTNAGQFNADFSSLSNILNELNQNRYTESQIRSQELDNAKKEATLDSDIESTNKGNSSKSRTYDYMEKYGLTDISPEWEKDISAIDNLVNSGKYLSLLESAKKFVGKVSPDVKQFFSNVADKAKESLVDSMDNSFKESSFPSFNFPKHDSNSSFESKPKNTAPKPKEKFIKKFYNVMSDKDNFFKQHKKKSDISNNNAKYWSNYANSYINK